MILELEAAAECIFAEAKSEIYVGFNSNLAITTLKLVPNLMKQ